MQYTPEHLERMSDTDIDCAVADKLGHTYALAEVSGSKEKTCVIKPHWTNRCVKSFCPTARWEEVMPIAEKYGIDVLLSAVKPSATLDFTSYYKPFYPPRIDTVINKNPRRAICEVFLMMEIEW